MDDVSLRQDPDGLCMLTLSQPDKPNALDFAMLERVDQEITALEAQTHAIGCAILRGATDGMPLARRLAHERYRHSGCAPGSSERIAAFARKSKS